MHSLASVLSTILTGLRAAIAAHMARPYADLALEPHPIAPASCPARPQPSTAIFTLAWAYIGRTAARLDRLIARWHTNTLPAPRIRAPRPQCARPATQPPKPRLPRGRAWLAIAADYHTRGRASQLNHLIESPDFRDFLAAAPQATRLLRPLCHILGIAPHLALPLRPRPPRIRPSRHPERSEGSTLLPSPQPPTRHEIWRRVHRRGIPPPLIPYSRKTRI